MERGAFDALARLVASQHSRRSALGTVLGAMLGGPLSAVTAKRKGKHRDQQRGHGKGNAQAKGKGGGHDGAHADAVDAIDDQAAGADLTAADAGSDAAPATKAGRVHAEGGTKGKQGKQGKKGKGRTRTEAKAAATAGDGCCGTKSCNPPVKQGNSYQCNFAGQNLGGKDYSQANFGSIDGRKANFSGANLTGTNFGNACLGGANFRTTDLLRANFGGACLFGADFTGATHFDFQLNFGTALLCDTTLPDGTVSNRDCGKASACCPQCLGTADCGEGNVCCAGKCVAGVCCANADCPPQTCQARACKGNQCRYTPISGATGPNCAGTGQRCCGGDCENTDTDDDNCGACGKRCPTNATCVGGRCQCDTGFKPCGIGCIPHAQCCTNNRPVCPEGQACCVTAGNGACQACCGTDTSTCPAPPACKAEACVDGTCDTSTNAPDGPQPGCPAPGCCNGTCCTGGQVCFQNGCCTPASNTCAGKCGTVTNNCGQQVDCGDCPAQTCKTGTCQEDHTCTYRNQPNGQPGTNCATVCCDGTCCTAGQVCTADDGCCTPATDTCLGKCGPVVNNCGQTIQCPACEVKTCQTGVCDPTSHTCGYTPITGKTGPNCEAAGQLCCTGACKDTNSDNNNCGGCGTACRQNASCVGGRCQCNSGFKPCGIGCISNSQCCTEGKPDCPSGQTCCVIEGNGICQECCGSDTSTCPGVGVCQERACANGICQPRGLTGGTCPFASGGTGACSNGSCICPQPRIVCSNGCCPAGAAACKTDGTCEAGCDVCLSGCPFNSLAAAVAGTPAGGTIRICPGTYPTNNVTIGQNLTIVGAGSGSDPAVDTILSGGNTSGILTILQAIVTIKDLTITQGNGTNRSGGIEVVLNSTLNLERVDLVGNTANVGSSAGNAGGGITVFSGSTVVIKSSHVANNTSQGGASAVGGGIFNGGTLTVESTRVEGNVARGGGGIFNGRGGAKLTLNSGAIITKNTANDPTLPLGGGIYNIGTIVDNDSGSNVFGNTPDNCVNEAPGTGCPA